MRYVELICHECGTTFGVIYKERNLRKFCSVRCGNQNINRRKKGVPTGRDMSGDKNPCWRGGISKKCYRYKLRFMAKNPEKVAAHSIVQKALKKGQLVRQPCRDCGSTTRIHAHHDDYRKPLEVIWLCQQCHIQHHAKLRRAA